MLADGDRPHAWSATAMGNAERLVHVDVAHIPANVVRACVTDHRVEVGAIDVHLPTMLVNQRRDGFDIHIEDAIGARISDHRAAEILRVCFALVLEVLQVDGSVLEAFDHDNFHSAAGRAGWIGSVRALGDEADVPLQLPLSFVVGMDDAQPGILALSTAVRLQ